MRTKGSYSYGSSAEELVLKLLKEPSTISDVVRGLKEYPFISRITVKRLLTGLEERGLVSSSKMGGYWQFVRVKKK